MARRAARRRSGRKRTSERTQRRRTRQQPSEVPVAYSSSCLPYEAELRKVRISKRRREGLVGEQDFWHRQCFSQRDDARIVKMLRQETGTM